MNNVSILRQSFYFGKGNRSKKDFFTISSGLQKSIRRGLVEDSLFYARELMEGGLKNYLIKRLIIILTEDIGLRNPHLAEFFIEEINNFEKTKTDSFFDENIIYRLVEQFAISKKSRECDNLLCSYSLGFMENTKNLNDLYFDIVSFYFENQKKPENREKLSQMLALLKENINVSDKNENYDLKIKSFLSVFSGKSKKNEEFIINLIDKRYGEFIDKEILENYKKIIFIGRDYKVGAPLILYFSFFELLKDNKIEYKKEEKIISNNNNFNISDEIEIKDFVYDKHTYAGKRLGRGFEHFFKEGGFLENEFDFNGFFYKKIIFKNYGLEI